MIPVQDHPSASLLRSIRPKRATDIESNCHHSYLQLTRRRAAGAIAPGGFMPHFLISGPGFARTNRSTAGWLFRSLSAITEDRQGLTTQHNCGGRAVSHDRLGGAADR